MKDVQSLFDSRNIAIQKAGVNNVRLPVMIPEKAGSFQNVTAEFTLCADLAANMKGTHMSRFMEILNSHTKKPVSGNMLKDILAETKDALKSNSAELQMRFRYFIEKAAPISGKTGFIDYICGFRAVLAEEFKSVLSMEIPVITLCPCSKEISLYGAHNQRAVVRINVEYARDDILWFEDLTRDIEQLASGELFSVLKRSDEKHVTEKAYENPKFVEDIVRDVIIYLGSLDGAEAFDVECESAESIHNHNAFAYINVGLTK